MSGFSKTFLIAILVFMPFCLLPSACFSYDSWWDPAGSDGWGAGADWHHRIPVTLTKPSGQDTLSYANVVAQTDIDFLSGGYDAIDTASPRLVRWTGSQWDTIALNGLNWVDQGGAAGYDKCSLRFRVHQNDLTGPSSLSVKYYLYFDTGTGKPNPNYPAISYSVFSDSFNDTSKISSKTDIIVSGGKAEISTSSNTWTQTSQADFGAAVQASGIDTLTSAGSVKLNSVTYSVGGVSGWRYRKTVTVTEPNVYQRTNAPCRVSLTFPESHCFGADTGVRVTTDTGAVVPRLIMNEQSAYPGSELTLHNTDFNSNNGGWTAYATGGVNDWAWGIPTSGPGSDHGGGGRCWATNLSGNYNSNHDAAVECATLDLSGKISATMTFWHYMSTRNGDGGWLEVWTTSNPVWTLVPSSELSPGYDGTASGNPAYSNMTSWTQVTFDMSAYLGNAQAKVRFRFYSTGSGNRPGWYIDDVNAVASTASKGSIVGCDMVFLVNCNKQQTKDYYVYYGNQNCTRPSYSIFQNNTGGTAYGDDGASAHASNVVTPHYSRINLPAGLEAYTTDFSLGVGDDNSTNLSLPWPIKFFGEDLNSLYTCANGLGTRNSHYDYTNTSGEFEGSFGGSVAPFWDDLYPADIANPGVYQNVYSNPDRCVWTWRMEHYNGYTRVANRRYYIIQAVFYKTGDIAFKYERLDNIITSPTTNTVDNRNAVDQGDAPGNRTVGLSNGDNTYWLRNNAFVAGNPTTTPGALYQCAYAFTTSVGSEEKPPPPYLTYGYFVSSKYDAGCTVAWNTISWDTSTSGSGSSVKFQTRTAGSAAGLDAAAWSNTYTVNPSSITSANGRWIQYRAVLQTSVPNAANLNYTPVLQSVSLNSVKYSSAAQIISSNTAESVPIVSVTPVWTAGVPAGASLNIAVSNDSGASYEAASNGAEHIFGSSGKLLRYKADLTSPGDTTPSFYDISLSYKTQQPDISKGSGEDANPWTQTYADSQFAILRSTFSQGETIYSKCFVLFNSTADSSVWSAPTQGTKQAGNIMTDTAATALDSYALPSDAEVGNWNVAAKTPAGNTVTSSVFAVHNKAKLLCSSADSMPAIVYQGQSNVKSQKIAFANTASLPGADLIINDFTLTFKDGGGSDTAVENLLTSVVIKKGAVVLQTSNSPSGSSLLIDFDGSPQTVNAGDTLDIDVYLNFLPVVAVGATLKTQLSGSSAVNAYDANSGRAVTAAVSPSWPLASGVCTIQSGPVASTYLDNSYSTLQTIFSQGQVVFTKVINLVPSTSYKCVWKNPLSAAQETHTIFSDIQGDIFDSYTLGIGADTGSWNISVITMGDAPVCNTNFDVQYKASLIAYSSSSMPVTVTEGQTAAKSQTVSFSNVTASPGAGILLDTFSVSFKDEGCSPVDINGILSKVEIKQGAAVLQTFNSPSGTSLEVNFGGSPQSITAGNSLSCDVYLDFDSGLSGGTIIYTEVSGADSVGARDVNSQSGVTSGVSPSWPLKSDSATIQAGSLNTYRDAGRLISQGTFSQGQRVYSKAAGLAANKEFECKWIDPSSVTQKTGTFFSNGSGEIISDSFGLSTDAETGTWYARVYRTATGRLVTSAVFTVQYKASLLSSATDVMPEKVSAGQTGVKSQVLTFQNNSLSPGASLRIDSFVLSFTDGADAPQAVNAILSKVQIKKGAAVIYTANNPTGTQLAVVIIGGETVIQGSSANYDVYLDFYDAAVAGTTLKTRISGSSDVYARDTNSDTPVVSAASPSWPLVSSAVTVENKATLLSSSVNYMPVNVTVGQAGVGAQVITFSNTAALPGASLSISWFMLSFKNAGGSPQDIGEIAEKVEIKKFGAPVQVFDYPCGDSITVDFSGTPQSVDAGASADFEIYIDVYETAPVGSTLRTQVTSALHVYAEDANSGSTITSVVSPAWPLASGAATIQGRPSFLATSQSFMPDTIAQGEANIKSQRFNFTNNAASGAAGIKLYSFTLSFRDASDADTSIEDSIDSIRIRDGLGSLLQTVSNPTGNSIEFDFDGTPQTILQGETLVIEVFINFGYTAPLGKTLKSLIKDTQNIDIRDCNSAETIVCDVYPAWPIESETTTVVSSPSVIETYFDPFYSILQDRFTIGQTVYSQSWGLQANTDHRSKWYDPTLAERKNTLIKSTAVGIVTDFYVGPDMAGTWRVKATTTGNVDICTKIFIIQYSPAPNEIVIDSAPFTINNSGKDDILTVRVQNSGTSDTADMEISQLKFKFLDGSDTSVSLTTAEAQALFDYMYIYRDINSNGAYDPDTDNPPVLSVPSASFSLTDGEQAFSFTDDDSSVNIVGGTERTYFLVVECNDNAYGASKNRFAVRHTPISHAVMKDNNTENPVSVTGAEVTSKSVDVTVPPSWSYPSVISLSPIYSSPMFYGSSLYVGCDDSKLYAMNIATGELKWTYDAGGMIRSSPFVMEEAGQNVIYFGADDGKIYAVIDQGAVGVDKWPAQNLGAIVRSSPMLDGVRLYVGCNDNRIYARNLSDGGPAWNSDEIIGGQISSSPSIFENTVYIGSDDGFLYALDAANGTFLRSFNTGGAIKAPIFAWLDYRIYIGSVSANFYCVPSSNFSSAAWTFNDAGQLGAVQSGAFATLGGDTDVVFFGSDNGHLYAVKVTGVLKWKYPASGNIGAVISSPLVYEGMVYFGCDDGYFYALDVETGERAARWPYYTGGPVRASAAIDDDGIHVSITSTSGKIYYFNLAQ